MGVVNVTPDSFSDGGLFIDPAAAARQVGQMLADGADLIDIGAESTRPGSQPVPDGEQIRRLEPVLHAVAREASQAVLSIDTTRAAVAEMAFDHGVTLANDISAGRDDPAMLPLVARRGVGVCLMHMLGTPATMQDNPQYGEVVAEVRQFLEDRVVAAVAAGIERHRILIDPGIGFGKTDAHNLELLRRLSELTAAGQPILVGTSRKGFIGRITGETDPTARQFGTAATICWAIANAADVVRVHDVKPMRQVVDMTMAIRARNA